MRPEDIAIEVLGLSLDEIRGESRIKSIADRRSIYHYVLREYKGMSLTEIGVECNRRHTTILDSLRKVESYLLSPRESYIKRTINNLRTQLGG